MPHANLESVFGISEHIHMLVACFVSLQSCTQSRIQNPAQSPGYMYNYIFTRIWLACFLHTLSLIQFLHVRIIICKNVAIHQLCKKKANPCDWTGYCAQICRPTKSTVVGRLQRRLQVETVLESLVHTSNRSRDRDGLSFRFRFRHYWFTLRSLCDVSSTEA